MLSVKYVFMSFSRSIFIDKKIPKSIIENNKINIIFPYTNSFSYIFTTLFDAISN